MSILNELKDIAQILAVIIAPVGGLIAAFRAIQEMREGRRQKQVEFRWRQAKEAEGYLERLFANKRAAAACRMLDWQGREFTLGNGEKVEIWWQHVHKALRTDNLIFDVREVFIRDAFDALLGEIERIEQMVSINLVRFEDVSRPIGYFVNLMAKEKPVFEGFILKYGYTRAQELFGRYEVWTGESR